MTIDDVRFMIQDVEGIPADQQVLCSDAGRLLGDWQTLGDSGIGREAVLRLLLAGDTLPAAPTAHATALSARRGGILALCVVVGALLLFALFHEHPTGCDENPCGSHGTCRYWTVQQYHDESSFFRFAPLFFVRFCLSSASLCQSFSPPFALVLSVPARNLHVSMSRVHVC